MEGFHSKSLTRTCHEREQNPSPPTSPDRRNALTFRQQQSQRRVFYGTFAYCMTGKNGFLVPLGGDLMLEADRGAVSFVSMRRTRTGAV